MSPTTGGKAKTLGKKRLPTRPMAQKKDSGGLLKQKCATAAGEVKPHQMKLGGDMATTKRTRKRKKTQR